jgi:hypothetical protein
MLFFKGVSGMKKKELVRRVATEMMKRENVDTAHIAAADVQARAESEYKQSISMPLIYMVLAEMKNHPDSNRPGAALPRRLLPKQPVPIAIGKDLLTAATVFIRAAGTIANARLVLDQVEELVGLVRDE